MSAEYVVKGIPAVRLVARTAMVDPEDISPHIGPMFDAVRETLQHIDGALATPIATYAAAEEGMDVVVGYAYDGPAPEGTEVVDLPQETAVCGVHLGRVAGIGGSWQALHRFVVDNGYEYAGPCREVCIGAAPEDDTHWVIELQQPVRAPASAGG